MVCGYQQDERGHSLKFVFTTERGLEDILADSLRGKGEVTPFPFSFQGRVLFECSSAKELLEELYSNPFYHKCALLLDVVEFSVERSALDLFYWVARKGPVVDFLIPSVSFGVRSVRKGKHPFSSQEVASYVGAGVIDGARIRKGFCPRVNLSDPDLLVIADVVNNVFLLGVELVGLEGMHRRGWRVYSHRAGLKGTLANALIAISGVSSEDVLWDPMCGGGTIPIEFVHRCIGVPPGYLRKNDYLFLRTSVFDRELWEEVVAEVDFSVAWQAEVKALASDRSVKALEGAKKNASRAMVEDKIRFELADVKESSFAKEADVVVTNPPYGLRLANPYKAERSLEVLMRTFAGSKARRLSLIHPEPAKVKEIADKHGLNLDKDLPAYNGNLEVSLILVSKS